MNRRKGGDQPLLQVQAKKGVINDHPEAWYHERTYKVSCRRSSSVNCCRA